MRWWHDQLRADSFQIPCPVPVCPFDLFTGDNQTPNCGNRQMYGHLISRFKWYSYVQEAQSRVDPEGSVLRRRCYSVPGRQHLWTDTGHHKLSQPYIKIVWSQLVTHGGSFDSVFQCVPVIMQAFSEADCWYWWPKPQEVSWSTVSRFQ